MPPAVGRRRRRGVLPDQPQELRGARETVGLHEGGERRCRAPRGPEGQRRARSPRSRATPRRPASLRGPPWQNL
eukprot:11182157-Lingulodinium_polyedra.AAC.1